MTLTLLRAAAAPVYTKTAAPAPKPPPPAPPPGFPPLPPEPPTALAFLMVRLLTVVVPLTTMNTRPLLSASMVKPLPANVTLLRIMGKVLVNVMLLAKLMVLPASVASLLTAKMASRSSASLVTTIGLGCH